MRICFKVTGTQLPAERKNTNKTLAGTIAIPWLGEHSLHVLTCIAGALKNIGPEHGDGKSLPILTRSNRGIHIHPAGISHCQLQPPGPQYIGPLFTLKRLLFTVATTA